MHFLFVCLFVFVSYHFVLIKLRIVTIVTVVDAVPVVYYCNCNRVCKRLYDNEMLPVRYSIIHVIMLLTVP